MDGTNDETRAGERYDWWSRHPRALEILYDVAFLGREATFRRRAMEALSLTSGERVLEVGCGNGNSFAAIHEAVGSTGTLVGMDASRGMVRSARNRIRDRGWGNVHVLRGDAQRPPLASGTFDAAYASMALSAVPNPERAIEATTDALRPGGRLVLLDAQPFQGWPWRRLNPLVVPVAEYATNWVPQVDLVAILRREFETVDVTTYNAGSILIARARRTATE